MENFGLKIKRFFDELGNKKIGEKYDNIVDLIDSFMDGNQDFMLSTFEEYSKTNGEHDLSNTDYDDFTKKAIYRFILEFEYMFPNILTPDEIIDRVKENLCESIHFDNLEGSTLEEGVTVSGYYNQKTKRIYLDNDLTSSKVDSVLFHEFLHCITINTKEITDKDIETEFLTETPVSLMQELFEIRKYNADKRCNNYITNYMRQFYLIFGDELISTYVKNYRDISPIFDCYPVKEYDNKTILHNYALLFNTINRIIKKGGDEDLLRYSNAIFEFNITLFLEAYLNDNPQLQAYDKLKMINDLFLVQKDPDLELYKYLIDENSTSAELLNRFPDLRYVKDKVEVGKLDYFTKEKYDNYEICNKYRFIHVVDYHDNPSFAKDNVFYAYPSSFYNDYIKNNNYYKIIHKLEQRFGLDIDDYDIYEVFSEYQNDSKSFREEMLVGADFTNKSLYDYRMKNMQEHSFMFKAEKDGHIVFIENSYGIDIYEQAPISTQFDTKSSNSERNRVLTELMEDDVDEVYVSDTNKNIISFKDDKVTVYTYKKHKKIYEKAEYEMKLVPCSKEHEPGMEPEIDREIEVDCGPRLEKKL